MNLFKQLVSKIKNYYERNKESNLKYQIKKLSDRCEQLDMDKTNSFQYYQKIVKQKNKAIGNLMDQIDELKDELATANLDLKIANAKLNQETSKNDASNNKRQKDKKKKNFTQISLNL